MLIKYNIRRLKYIYPLEMGGCRCSFRQCANSSLNSPGYHFFHYPIRDATRCQRWADFADKREFLKLAQSVLKNKVVCQDHFKDSHFMNYLKESLIKTAVPTLHIENGQIIDLETVEGQIYMEMSSDANEMYATANEPVKQLVLQKIDAPRKRHMVELSSGDQPVVKFKLNVMNEKIAQKVHVQSNQILTPIKSEHKKKIQNTPVILNKIKSTSPKILNTSLTQPIITPEASIITESSQPYETIDIITTNYPQIERSMANETLVETIVTQHPPQIERKDIEECLRSTLDSIDFVTNESFSKNLLGEKKILANIDEMVKKLHAQQNVMIEMLQKQPVASPADSTTSSSANKNEPKSKFNQNKIQLFSGIKKYLSPAMVTMLRVELFGTADREWKPDEKSMMTDVLRLGSNVYEFMRDEWRLRFPPLKDVETWMSENLGNNEDDDC